MRVQRVATLMWHSMWLVLIVSWHLSPLSICWIILLEASKIIRLVLYAKPWWFGGCWGSRAKCRQGLCGAGTIASGWCKMTSAAPQHGMEQGWVRPGVSDLLQVFPSPRASGLLQSQHVAGQDNGRDGVKGWHQGNFRWKEKSQLLVFTLYTDMVYFILATQWLIVTFDI